MLREADGTPRQICGAATAVVRGYQHDADAGGFKRASIEADAACSTVSAFPAYADVPGGMPKATDREVADALKNLDALEEAEGQTPAPAAHLH